MDFFDLRTAYLIMGVLYFAMPLAVWLALWENRTRAVTEWCVGGALFGLGLLLLSQRHQLPNWLTYEAAVLCMNLGHLARVTALRHELQRPLGRTATLLLPAIFLLFYEIGRWGDPQGSLPYMVSLASLVVYFFWIALLALQLARQDRLYSAYWLGFIYLPLGLLVLIHLIRVALGVAEPGPMHNGWGAIAMALMGNITAVIGNTSFLGVYVERANRRQLEMAAEQARSAESARLGQQIAQLDRVRGMGMITASVVHELSQPLASIQLLSEHAEMEGAARPGDTPALLSHIGKILDQSRHASGILHRVRHYIATRETQHAPVSLQDVNGKVMDLLRDWLRMESVSVQVSAPASPVLVRGDDVQLAQILVNLYRNSIQASAGQTQRRIVVRIGQRQQHAFIAVEDNGPGFSAQALEQGQTAKGFFSTKSDGLGVGLMISRQIAQQHQGQLTLDNRPEGGAVVELELPLLRPETGHPKSA